MLFILFVLGSCALLTSGWVSVLLWLVFYVTLAFISFSLILHSSLHLRSLPPRFFRQDDRRLFDTGAPYRMRPADMVLPGQSAPFLSIHGD